MNELSKFKISEEFKNYFSAMNKDAGEFKVTDKAIDETGPKIAETHVHFQEIRKESGALQAVRYLWDVCAYYMALCSEFHTHNQELIRLLKIAMDKLPDDETLD